MSYTPTNWQTGDTITAVKLNNAESGIVSASPFIISGNYDDYVEYGGQGYYMTDANYDELVNAIKSDRLVYFRWKTVEEGTFWVNYVLLNVGELYDDPSTGSTIEGKSCTYSITTVGQTVTISMQEDAYHIIKNQATEAHANCLVNLASHRATVTTSTGDQ